MLCSNEQIKGLKWLLPDLVFWLAEVLHNNELDHGTPVIRKSSKYIFSKGTKTKTAIVKHEVKIVNYIQVDCGRTPLLGSEHL